LGCEVIYNKSIIRYQLIYGTHTIIEEKLILLDEKKEVTLIDRKQTGVVTGKLIKASIANQLYVQEMQPNVTVLSKLAQHGPYRGVSSAQPYFQAIQNATRVEDYATSTGARITGTDRIRFADDAEYREWIMMHLISAADVGISDVTTRKQDFTVPKEVRDFLINDINSPPVLPDKAVIVAFLHQGKTKSMIDYLYESSGTKKLLNISNELWMLAHESVTILADELSASLHPRLLDRMIRSINEYPVKIKSQLIFATHDTGLLESQDGQPPALRRDQVYFTKKDEHGASELYSLAEFKEDARPVHNIRKRYLSGLYGALPSLEKLKL